MLLPLSRFNLHLLPFSKYKIAYLHLLVKRKHKRKSRFFVNAGYTLYRQKSAADLHQPRQRPPIPADHAGERDGLPPAQKGERAADLPERETGSSVIVVGLFSKVADHSRKP